jgi:hypothetical protein
MAMCDVVDDDKRDEVGCGWKIKWFAIVLVTPFWEKVIKLS